MSGDDKLALIFGGGLLFLAGILLGAICSDCYEQSQAVKHGAARYNPQTGYFQWLDEIQEK